MVAVVFEHDSDKMGYIQWIFLNTFLAVSGQFEVSLFLIMGLFLREKRKLIYCKPWL